MQGQSLYDPADPRWAPEIPSAPRGEKPTRAHIEYILARLPIIGFQYCPDANPMFLKSDLLKLVEP